MALISNDSLWPGRGRIAGASGVGAGGVLGSPSPAPSCFKASFAMRRTSGAGSPSARATASFAMGEPMRPSD